MPEEVPQALANLLKLVGGPRDGALLRYSLGAEYLKTERAQDAIVHLTQAVAWDPRYSAAWKLLGKAQTVAGDAQGALASYREGIRVAEARGDIQAAKEMRVFAKRLEQSASDPPTG